MPNIRYNNSNHNLVDFDKAYPVGTIYMNLLNSANPSTYLGGGYLD